MLQTLADIPNTQARQNELQYRLKHLERSERVQLLSLSLDDPYPPLRHDVAEGFLGELRRNDTPDRVDEAMVEFLEAIATDNEPSDEVLNTLAIPRELLPQDSMRARITACVALEASPWPKRTANNIRPLLKAESSDLRYQAVIATHRLAAGSSILHEVVADALHDEDPEIVVVGTQIAVKEGWHDLFPAFLEARARLGGEDRLQITFSVGELVANSELNPEDIPPAARGDMIAECIDSLRHEPHTASAIKTLAHLNATEAAEELVTVTKRWFAHPILKVEAAAALIDLGHPRGEEYIERALSSRRKDARGYALRIIGSHKLDRFFTNLVEVATGHGYHADTATLALTDFGGTDAKMILQELATAHSEPEVRRLARRAIESGPTIDPDSFDASLDR